MRGCVVARYYAVVAAPLTEPTLRHTLGLPQEIRPDVQTEFLAWPRVITIEPSPEGGLILYRYTALGEPAGDTWHRDVGEAMAQATYEYAESLGPWTAVADEVADLAEFALRAAGLE